MKDKEFCNRWYGVHGALILSSSRLFRDLQKHGSLEFQNELCAFLQNAWNELLTNKTAGK